MEILDNRTSDGVHFPLLTRAVIARVAEFHGFGFSLGVSLFPWDGLSIAECVPSQRLFSDLSKTDAANLGRGARRLQKSARRCSC